MKKSFSILFVIIALFAITTPALAVKPAGAEFVDWNLSGAVMPVPPYGSLDIPGSDTASKLIVNQPNGNTEVVINGVMKGLHPNATYTVYLARAYAPMTSYPGLFTSTVQPFTFITDEYGTGNWHLNLRNENFPGVGTYGLSVFINYSGRTILISDNFDVTVD